MRTLQQNNKQMHKEHASKFGFGETEKPGVYVQRHDSGCGGPEEPCVDSVALEHNKRGNNWTGVRHRRRLLHFAKSRQLKCPTVSAENLGGQHSSHPGSYFGSVVLPDRGLLEIAKVRL